MYFSAKQYHSYLQDDAPSRGQALRVLNNGHDNRYPVPKITQNQSRKALRLIKTAIASRNHDLYSEYLGKWIRPWTAVPELKTWAPPKGDFGVGVEIEMGFRSHEAAKRVAAYVEKWKYLTLDFEGGTHPIEATFAPVVLSKMYRNSQVFRYLDYLKDNRNLVTRHHSTYQVGTHVNVSMGGVKFVTSNYAYNTYQRNTPRTELVANLLGNMCYRHEVDVQKYFGRQPYGYCHVQGGGRWIEYKLFNSQLESSRLKQYINIAVELTKLIAGKLHISEESIVDTLETGYNKPLKMTTSRGTLAVAA